MESVSKGLYTSFTNHAEGDRGDGNVDVFNYVNVV